MKLLKFITPAVALLLLGGIGYLTLTDVSIPQKEIRKVIPNDRFFDHPTQ